MLFLSSEKSPAQAIKKPTDDNEITAESPQDNEFISDAFQADQINEEDLKKEMEMLGVEDGKFKDEGNSIFNKKENKIFASAKTKAQISCAVTAQLISAFVFATQIVQIDKISNIYSPSVIVKAGLCWTRSETLKSGFCGVAAHMIMFQS